MLPLVLSTGAGAASRRSIGTGVFGGMIAATLLAVVFVPLFYVLVMNIARRGARDRVSAGELGGGSQTPVASATDQPQEGKPLP